MASKGHPSLLLLISTLLATSCIIASACVFNNVLDRSIDAHMSRTKSRALVTKTISVQNALLMATALGVIGFFLLVIRVNVTTTLVGLAGFITYLLFYGYAKRHSPISTIIGSISGATPPVAGYAAVTGHLDLAALLLFIILAAWQMPHFYAIAMYRRKEYAAASLPVLTVAKGNRFTKFHIVFFVLVFAVATVSLSAYGYSGLTYAVVMGALSLYWLQLALKGFWATDDEQWARSMFRFSLIVISSFSVFISLSYWLP